VFAGPAISPAVGVMETRHMPLASVILHDTRASLFLTCLIRTDLQRPLLVTVPRVVVAVYETLLRGVIGAVMVIGEEIAVVLRRGCVTMP